MPNRDSALGPLLAAAAAAIAIAIFVSRSPDTARTAETRPAIAPATVAASAPGASPGASNGAAKSPWAVSAPGRVEPKGGEVRLSPQANGRIAEVMIAINQKVMAGDLLIRLEDTELEARLAAADAEASVRRRDRDQETVGVPARERRAAEDAAFAAERLHSLNRSEFDRWLIWFKRQDACHQFAEFSIHCASSSR